MLVLPCSPAFKAIPSIKKICLWASSQFVWVKYLQKNSIISLKQTYLQTNGSIWKHHNGFTWKLINIFNIKINPLIALNPYSFPHSFKSASTFPLNSSDRLILVWSFYFQKHQLYELFWAWQKSAIVMDVTSAFSIWSRKSPAGIGFILQ